MFGSITEFIQDDTGQGIIEYAGVLAFAAGVVVLFAYSWPSWSGNPIFLGIYLVLDNLRSLLDHMGAS